MTQAFDRDQILSLSNREIRERYMAAFNEAPKSPNKVWMVNQLEQSFQRTRVREEEAREAAQRRSAAAAEAAEPAPLDVHSVAAAEAPSPVAEAPAEPALELAAPDATAVPLEVAVEHASVEEPAASDAASATPPEPSTPHVETTVVVAVDADPESEADDTPPETQPAPLASTARELPAPAESGPQLVATAEHEAASATDAIDAAPATAPRERGRYRGMTVEELREAYVRIVGRPTSSTDKPYLVWKITQVEKGLVRPGPVEPGMRREGALAEADKTLPLTIAAAAVVAVDEAWARQGFRSRMAFLRTAIRETLLSRGETEAAAHFPESTAV